MQDVTSFSFSSSAMDDERGRHVFIGWPLSERGNWSLGVHQDSLGMLRGAVRSAFGPGVIGVLTKEK
jgi:hypothetical protein